MDALSLNYWLTKFIQDVAKPSKERYPANGNVIPDWSTNQLTPFVSAKGLVKNQSFPSLIQYESINFNTRLDYINGNKTRIRVLWSISLLTKVQWEKWNEAHFFFLKIFQGNGNKKNRQKRVNFYFRNEFSGKKKVLTAQTIFPPADKAAGAKLDDWLTTVFCAQKKVNLYTRNICLF